ncbi:putative aldouronate transport system permease protein [Paenibacillus methanolicus]|uniref:Putative aldouronate transport system permease protein n=2 Tax=Paenibacillus methanolicus TaxID=582686 RepID=A0A5S5CDH2_9BACL|nr:putative aldouronate transport system permease protein [Paenibacillus methanolicus]
MKELVLEAGKPRAERAAAKGKWNLKRNWPLHMMLVPAVLLTLLFQYVPMGGLVIAFQDFKPWLGLGGSKWVGLDNFRFLFKYPGVDQVIWNTLIIAFFKIVAGLIAPFLFAVLLNEVRSMAFKRISQTLVYLPHFLSWVILGGILLDILSPDGGMVNKLVVALGGQPVFFLGDGDWFRVTLIVSDVWKEFGFGTIVFLASLAGINPALYEAAEVDGANRLKQTLHITLPALLPIAIVLLTLSIGNILNAGFDQVFNLYNPLVYEKGDIIDTFVYRLGILNGKMSFATTVGLFKSVVGTVLIVVSYWLAYRLANYRVF